MTMILNRFGKHCGLGLAVLVLIAVSGDTIRVARAAEPPVSSIVTLYEPTPLAPNTNFAYAVLRQPSHAEVYICQKASYQGSATDTAAATAFFQQYCTEALGTYFGGNDQSMGTTTKRYLSANGNMRFVLSQTYVTYNSDNSDNTIRSGVDTFTIDLFPGAVPAGNTFEIQGANIVHNGLDNPTLNSYHTTYLLVGQGAIQAQPIQD
jgi:hypothetical protein